ncbi:MAG: NAD(P)H-hydrate dehydratase [Phycisphaerales bacterium]|nr:NAD(P)H-hydrate dehydratase [Phycisphaerales bacterium]MDP6692736.1 NAD(P)H-hydrate dehydratase [Phycisphaerales bacterium]
MKNNFQLPPRPPDGHKGTFGSVCVIGGQRSEDGLVMIGAPTLSANAAMRVGCGRCILALPQPILRSALALTPTATGIELPVDEVGRLMSSSAVEAIDRHGSSCRCLVIGPGFGDRWSQQQIIATLLARDDRPILLDADGLNAFSQLESGHLELRAPTIMTPHIGEYQRLAKTLGITIPATEANLAAEALAQTLGCIVVLKSNNTIISDGVNTIEETRGSVVLATGGTGDVLSGIIAGLAACYGADCSNHLMEAAVLGVRLHAMAGNNFEEMRGNTGMLATDLLDELPGAIKCLREDSV